MSIWLLMYLFLWKQYFMQYSSKIHFPNLPDPIYKSNCPLNLMPVRASLDSKNCSEVFTITGNASLTSLWRNDHLCLAELFYFSQNESFWTWTAWLRLCQSISTWFKSGLWLSNSKTFFLFCFLNNTEVDFWCVSDHCPSVLPNCSWDSGNKLMGGDFPSGFSVRERN